MNKREGVGFLFTIVKEFQRAFETPVILFTQKDYVDDIFKILVDIRQALLDNEPPEKISEIVNTFHINWLEAIQEIEKVKKRIKEIPRDVILKAIDFTKHSTRRRVEYFRKYIDNLKSSMSEAENQSMYSEIITTVEMQEIHNSALTEKLKYIRSQADQTEYHNKIHDEIEELMNWLDRLYNSLSIQFCKTLNLKVPVAPSDLTKTLKQIINEVAADPAPEAQRVVELINIKGKMLGSMIRISAVHEIEISKIVEKIRVLENRISRLQSHNSSALMALKLKTLYLEERLQSLENINVSMNILSKQNKAQDLNDLKNVHIFNHLLPHHDRCRLVEQLVQLWNGAIIQHDHESIISILSVADLKETFSDDNGNFTVDKYGRKIYTKSDDEILYQLNERNELVPLGDDPKHVYFYDACGRYYINDTRERVYKDHDGAGEYVMSKGGYLVKVLEEIDGTDYYYDWLGRYYINEKGQHIYCDENSTEEYEHDGLGNLVKIHGQEFYYDPHPKQVMTMDESKYLKQVVGDALKKCIADVVLHQPNDPVKFLADCLERFSNNITTREKRVKDEQERFEEQKLLEQTKEKSPDLSSVNEDDDDDNLINYKHQDIF